MMKNMYMADADALIMHMQDVNGENREMTGNVPLSKEIDGHLDDAINHLNEANSYHVNNQKYAAAEKFGHAARSITLASKRFDNYGDDAHTTSEILRAQMGSAHEMHQEYLTNHVNEN
jgi:hypothetical protein